MTARLSVRIIGPYSRYPGPARTAAGECCEALRGFQGAVGADVRGRVRCRSGSGWNGEVSITVAGSLLTEKYSSFCTCSVRALCELGSRKGTNRRSKEDRAAITTSKMGGATVMLGDLPK